MLRCAALFALLLAAGCHSPRPPRSVPAPGDVAPRPVVIPRRSRPPAPFTRADYRPYDRPLAWRASGELVIGHMDIYSHYDVVSGACDGTGFYTLRPGARAARRLLVTDPACDALYWTPALSEDASWAVFTAMGRRPDWRDRLARLDLATGRVDTLATECSGELGGPALSRDGTRIATVGRCDPGETGGSFLYEIRADGTGIRRVSTVPARSPSWSPDGQRIVAEQEPHVVVIGREGEGRHVLARGEDPAWSPDGDWIAFLALDSIDVFPAAIHLVRPDGSGKRRVFRNEVRTTRRELARPDGQPDAPLVWSPDSRWIAFSRSFDRGTSVWRVEVETGRVEQLTQPDR